MYKKHSIKTPIVIGILLMTTVGLLFPSTSASIETDGIDGFWINDFIYKPHEDPYEDLILTNCTINVNGGTITLDKTVEPKKYDFTDNSHDAYSFSSIFSLEILPFKFITNIHLIENNRLDKYTEIPNIRKENDDKYAEWSSSRWKTNVFHYFRIKLDVSAEDIGELSIYWKGYAENDEKIKLYFLQHITPMFGLWVSKNSTQSQGNITTLTWNLTEDQIENALDDNNYIDVCIVTNTLSKSDICTLYTDYIKIDSGSEDVYIDGPAYVETKNPINPRSISSIDLEESFYWGILTWEDYERNDATITHQVYYKDSSENYTLVEDTYLDGNSEGLTDSPVSLTKLPIDTHGIIKLKATLLTEDISATPKLFEWGVTWQLNRDEWRDSFNSSLRTDIKNKVEFLDTGNVTILPVRGDWPMFGQNPQNTRNQEGNGPDSEVLHWYSVILGNRRIINPVIRDTKLYTSFEGSKRLYVWNDVTQTPSEGEYIIEYSDRELISDRELSSSFALTDNFIIFTTGEIDSDGITNSVYCLDRSTSTYEEKWDFPIEGSFYSAPIVYDDKIFITSWSGDPNFIQNNENNKVYALSLSSGTLIWEYDLPAHSFSTPAVYNDMVYVGCKETLFSDDTFFVLDANGNGDGTTDVLWNATLGSIGRSSPVISDDKVFVVSEEKGIGFSRMKLTALDAITGEVFWDEYVSRRMSIKIDITNPHIVATLADSTPAVYENKIFVSSPDGNIVAFETNNGTELWKTPIYMKSLFSLMTGEEKIFPILSNKILTTSPSFADGKIYVGTPDGNLYALDASDGAENVIFESLPKRENHAIVTSPIISNGLVYFGDDNGKLYAVGEYIAPDKDIEGSITSIPITCPQGRFWKEFNAGFDDNEDGNDIEFSILDKNKNHITTIEPGDTINLGDRQLERTIRLRANLSADNITVNPELSYWYVSYDSDDVNPDIVEDSFKPNIDGWLNELTPLFSINVWDNDSGLLLSSSEFGLGYYENSSILKTHTGIPEFTGENGANFTTLTVDIESLDFSENITKLDFISFSIKDIAYNEDSFTKNLKQDTTKPTSSISNETNGSKFTSEFVVINISKVTDPLGGEDESSGVASVQLKYRYSSLKVPNFSGDWEDFGEPITSEPFTWNFTGEIEGSHSKEGHYELITIATDNAENVEDGPESGDISFILDNEPPDEPDVSGEHYFNSLPEISIEFSDGFLLDTIKYRPEFEPEWTLIALGIDQAAYDAEWDLPQDYWDQMEDGEEYTLYFWINDSLGNTQIIDDGGYKIIKDAAGPNVDLEIPALETEWSFEDTFKITAFASDGQSDIKSVELFYQYSEDGKFDGDWTSYGVLTFEPFEWEFEAEEGNGYYEFKVVAEDLAGNVAESEVFSTGINIFPLFSVVAMVLLIIALIIITIVIFIKWRKK